MLGRALGSEPGWRSIAVQQGAGCNFVRPFGTFKTGVPMAVQQRLGTPFWSIICAFQFGPRRGYNVAQEQSPAGRGPTATFPLLKSHV